MQWSDIFTALSRSIRLKPIRPRTRIVKRSEVRNTPAPSTNNKLIEYMLNDPTLPIIKQMIPPVAPTNPRFSVAGYAGGGFPWKSTQGQAATVFATIANMINYTNLVSDVKLTKWAGTSNLVVLPRAGRALNAYYNRASLSFFFEKSPKTGLDIYTADSSDAVSHELGHAILDSFRPELFNMPMLEVWAFHESFGDCMALSNMLLHDECIQHVLNETGNNLRQDNIITKIAEEVGLALSVVKPGQNSEYLRDANNNFVYVSPANLPKSGSADVVFAQPHSFSRIMTGAYYDIFVMMYNDMRERMNPFEAMHGAINLLNKYFFIAVTNAAIESQFYKRIAHAMLWADHNNGRVYHDRMWQIFSDRNMISHFDVLNLQMTAHEMHEESHRNCTHIRLCDCGGLAVQSESHSAKVQVPYKSQEIIDDVRRVINYLDYTGGISDSEHTPFCISNGELLRTGFFCGCGTCGPNKFQPEYYRPYKPQNNTGCCGKGKAQPPVERKPMVRRGCAIRYTVVK